MARTVASVQARRRREREGRPPVKFVTVEEAFEPMIRVRALLDISGWVNRERGIKWSISKNEIGMLSQDAAREFSIKGYVEILDGTVKPVSEDEAAEMLSTVTTVSLGGSNG